MTLDNTNATAELWLEYELLSALSMLQTINLWDSDTYNFYKKHIVLIMSQVKLLDRRINSVVDMCSIERELLVDLLIVSDMDVEEVLLCIELFNAISGLLLPNQLHVLRLQVNQLNMIHLKLLPFHIELSSGH
ncbi:hypothetical protein [Vibrio methylphosphonaticus]|uniref:hypothetical protein n=1 Tax=Vibrio methylphosphonaticus TaxID=2946866 RepID=UPI00202A43CD|nr:hypothetical protein [Vibrio methylphosphonaticus]MCL9774751.1 hypothetical protein [Vibrio methylphosphonaticus]